MLIRDESSTRSVLETSLFRKQCCVVLCYVTVARSLWYKPSSSVVKLTNVFGPMKSEFRNDTVNT